MESFDQAIQDTVRNIWTVILGLDVNDGPRAIEALDKIQSSRTLTACVQLTGAWEGTVLLVCTADLGKRMAAIMFGSEELGGADLEDALGELANMVGGNVKTLLPGPTELSLPAVVEGLDYRLMVPGAKITSKVLFECAQEPLLITLLERAREGDESPSARSVRRP